jgi:hypothetical protein
MQLKRWLVNQALKRYQEIEARRYCPRPLDEKNEDKGSTWDRVCGSSQCVIM